MVYFSFVCLLKLILYNSKPQNQMCDGNQKSFCFVLQLRLFYMVHTFVSEVSLHSWLIWPTVRWLVVAVWRGAARWGRTTNLSSLLP